MRKNVVPSFKMIDAASLGASLTSAVVNVINMDKASVHVAWSGTAPLGTMTVEARNGSADPWYTLEFDVISISGSPGVHQLIFNELPFTDIRLQYARTSGTGSMTATISMKQTGG